MLLFILSFCLHYDLNNCDETVSAKFNESLIIDKHRKNLLQVNAFLKEHEDLPADFHPTPQYYPSDFRQGLYHWLPRSVFPGFKLPLPPLVIPRPRSPYPMPVFPLKNPGPPYPGFLLRPIHSMDPGLPPSFLPDYRYQNIYLRPPDPYFPSLSYTPGPTRPKRVPVLYEVNLYLQKNPRPINPLHPTISPLISDPAVSSKTPPPVTVPFSTKRTTTIDHKAKIWLQEIAPYTPSKKARILVQAKDSEDFENEVSTVAGDVLHGKITVKKVIDSTPPSPAWKHRYLDLMKQLDEGYMMVFMIEVCRIIGVKEKQEIQDVIHRIEMIYNSLSINGGLAWLGEPFGTVIWKMTIISSGRDIDVVRTYASMTFQMLLKRKQTLSKEVNSIIDKAAQFYNDDEGNRLLYSLHQFEGYPKTNTNSYWLCDSLIESFLAPFRSHPHRRQLLIGSINKALKQRFPHLMEEHNRTTHAPQASLNNGTRPRKRKKKHHHSHKKKRKRKIHRIPEYNTKNMYETQYSLYKPDYKESILRTMAPALIEQSPRFRAATSKAYRTQQRQPTTAYFNLETRSTRNRKPSYQKTTPFQEKLDFDFRKNYKITQQTVHHHHFRRKSAAAGQNPPPGAATSTGPKFLASSGFHSPGRPKRAWNDKKPFYHGVKDGLKESEVKNKDKRLKLKAELLLEITESSSYSDDEVSLTKKLYEALRYVNKTVDLVDEKS